ncbi:hypothetical protein LTR96_000121 [Exophiala xenobiotica]|nr:hypothetical protein LTR92_003478 [Exophiala xenobiotica]KAK5236574.1 hypothetical protein LTR47_002525 [Exophiala xenobiotica]KAK5247679.1 hypothetical protein LTS06_007178 [Exophiala xenobiotica]KAK5273521.1 hypothetical protein LTR96_000121 [Exophiala xenobiotica]KAK5350684.1 hypothetical protein LTR61_005881 [Exophiala xenobiotica]
MAGIENHFTVFIRLPFNRGEFVDPPPVAWSAVKESALWNIISRQAKGNEIDWRSLSEQFEVSQSFLLQQAAWLYERQLSQVRAQMRRVGSRQSATPSPIPGSVSASMVGGQAMKRAGSGGSRVPSRLSTQALGSPVITGGDSSTPGTPAKSRTSLPFRSISGQPAGPSQARGPPGTSRPISRQESSKDSAPASTTQSRRGSIQHQLARSPGQQRNLQPQSSDSEDDMTQSRIAARRPNPSAIHRRALSQRQPHRGASVAEPNQQQAQQSDGDDDDDDDEDEPSFLPFANPSSNPPAGPKERRASSSQPDPSATLRGNVNVNVNVQTQAQPIIRPSLARHITSERDKGPTSSTSSLSSPTQGLSRPMSNTNTNIDPATIQTGQAQTTQAQAQSNVVPRVMSNPLSPPHRALLLQSSPRRGTGSDTSPSMGSSFSDLDDASVTQSALEEALLSGMGNTTMTMPGGGGGTVAGRVSGISQALRSRYFDARGEPGQQRNAGGNGGGVSER